MCNICKNKFENRADAIAHVETKLWRQVSLCLMPNSDASLQHLVKDDHDDHGQPTDQGCELGKGQKFSR